MRLFLRLLATLTVLLMAREATAQSYKNYIDSQYTTYQSIFESDLNSGVASRYYNLQYVLLGWNAAYQAFGDVTYINRVLLYAETMVAEGNALAADSCGKRSWSGTVSTTYTNQLGGSCVVTNVGDFLSELQGATEMARVAALITIDPVLAAQTQSGFVQTYGQRAAAVASWLHTNMVVKWVVNRNQQSHSTSFPWDDKAMQMLNILVGMEQAGYSSTNIKTGLTYRQYATAILNAYMPYISAPTATIPCGRGTCVGGVAAVGGEIWQYKGLTTSSQCGQSTSPCSRDTAHANRWPNALQRAVDYGYSSSISMDLAPTGSTLAQHVQKLGELFEGIIWNGNSTTDPRFTNYTDGANNTFFGIPAWENGIVAVGWADVSHYNSNALDAVEAMTNCVIAGASCTSPSKRFNFGTEQTPHARTAMAGTTAYAQFRFSGGGTPTPVLNTSPATLNFSGFVNGSQPAPQNITITDTAASGAMGWVITDNQSWISTNPTSGNNNGTVAVAVSSVGLAAGVHTGEVTVTASGATGSPDVVAINLTLTPPTLTRTPTTLSFSALSGGSNPASKSITIEDTANSGVMSWTITDDAAWITVTPSSGIDDAVVTVNIDIAGLPVAVHNGTITITSTGAVNSPLTVAVDLTITNPPAPPAQGSSGRIR